MYLKSLSIKNYRKYGEEVQTINFAHSKWSEMSGAEDESEKINRTEEYISKSSSLIVGKNNSGKSTIVKLLNTLQNTKSGSRNIFKYTDFNLKMLSDWYRFNIDNKSKEDIESIDKSDFPKLEFQLILGIDDENDLISSFEDILILGGIETVGTHENQEVAEVTIDVKYEVADVQSFLEELVKIKSSPREKIEQYDQGYQKELRYRKFLSLFSSNYFVLNFYPIRRDEPAKEFSLSSLLKVATIEANTVKNDKTLSQAYNKIVSTYIKNNDIVEIDKKAYEYIKKYLRLEITDIFFADAVVLVEGVSEETYLRYEIDRHSILKNHHVKVYRIDGAYAHQFISLLDLLGVRTVIFTDLDLKRSESEKKVDIKDNAEPDVIPSNIPDLEEKYGGVASSLTTNGTIQYFVKKLLNDDKAKYDKINSKIIEILTDKEELVVEYNNISMYSQGKINKYYATSFEEAIVLTNAGNEDENKYKKSLIKALQYVHPNMRYFGDIDETSEIADKSYMYQVKLSDGKSKFSTGIVYLSITDKEFSLKRPQYVESGLNLLCGYFEE